MEVGKIRRLDLYVDSHRLCTYTIMLEDLRLKIDRRSD